jgi:hypothetical protein
MKSKKNVKKNRGRNKTKKGGDYNDRNSRDSSIMFTNEEKNEFLNPNYEKETENNEANEANEQSEQFFPPYARYTNYEKELVEFQKQYNDCCEQTGKNIKIKQFIFFSKNKCPKYNCDQNTSTIFNRIKVLKSNIDKIKKFQLQVRNANRSIMSLEDAIKTINSIKNSSTSFSVLDKELQEIWNNKETKNVINDPSNVPNTPPKKGFFSSFTRKMPYSYFNPSPSSQLKKINPELDKRINANINTNPDFGVSSTPANVGGKRTRRLRKNRNRNKKIKK